MIATGHLRVTSRPREEIRPDIGIVTFAELDSFRQRLVDEREGNTLATPLRDVTVPTLTGVSGLALDSTSQNSISPNLLLADLNQTTGSFSQWNIDEVTTSTSAAVVSSESSRP